MDMQLENGSIHYQLYNSPKLNTDYIVLIHGLGLDLTMWTPLIPHLQEHYHIITFDIRGHGNTTRQIEQITWDLLVHDLHSLLENLNLEQVHLVGYGFGGNLAIKYNESYPEKVKKIILTSVYMYFPENATKREVQKRKELVTTGKMSDLSRNMIHQICYNLTPEKELLLTKAYNKVEMDTYFNMFELLVKTVSLQDLANVDKEVLLIQGDKDPLFPIQQTNLYQSYLNKSVSYTVPNSSNLVPLDSPCSFITLIGHFIKEGISNNFTMIMEQELTDTIDNLLPKTFNTLEITIIDGFSVKYRGSKIEDKWNQRKAKNLLAYLAYYNPSSREDLIEVFWGDHDLASAQNNLRVALNHLKGILQNHHLELHLQIDREQIRLIGDISFDLANFMQLLNRCMNEQDPMRRRTIFNELMTFYKERMFLDMYDDWLLDIQHEIDIKMNTLSESLT